MVISDVAIRRPVFTWMLMIALILFGSLTFRQMGISLLPDVDFPVVSISLKLDGAAPEVMESQVIDPVESSLLSVQGIQTMSSSAKSGGGDITLEFDLSKDVDVVVQEVQTILAQAQRKLPPELEPPIVRKRNPEDRPIIQIAVSSEKWSKRELMEYVRDYIKDKFTVIDGVAEVTLGGFVDPNLRLWLSVDKMNKYDLTVDDIVNTIQKEHRELPAGLIEKRDTELSVRVLGEAATVEDFKKMVIQRRGGAPNFKTLRLEDVAMIEDSLADIRRVTRANGVPSVGLGIIKERGSNAVEVGDQVKSKIKEIQAQLPPEVKISLNFDNTQFIKDSVHELLYTLLFSALLTALVCWLFLGSFSATINVILAIPTSIIGSFIVLKFLNFTLNTFTILGLSLAIGIVVDDAIMVLENIVRHREAGKSKVRAAIIGTREISFAALAATAAIIAIFLPVAFMKGIIGRYFFQFGVTISVTVALSLFEALTLTPMRCSQFLAVGHTSGFGKALDHFFSFLAQFYEKVLSVCLRFRWLTIGFSLILFLGSLSIVRVLKKEFVPPQDQGALMLRVQCPEGSSLSYTDGKVKEVEKILSQEPSIMRYLVAVGGYGGGDVNTAMGFITLKPLNERAINPETKRPFSQIELMARFKGLFKSLNKGEGADGRPTKVYLQDGSMSGLGGRRGYPIEFSLRGPDWEKLIEFSNRFVGELEKDSDLTDVNSDYVAGAPEVQVVPDRAHASQYGVSVGDIAQTLSYLVGGVVPGLFTKNGKRYDIRMRLASEDRSQETDINKLQVRNNRGETIALSRLVTLKSGTSPKTISRADRMRSITISANLSASASQAHVIEKIQQKGKEILPPQYLLVMSGSSKEFQESTSSLLFALLFGIVIAYMVLASQFNSFTHPLTVLMALPFSVTGAFLALLLGGQSLNVYSMIGLILLMGIVKKNSILLVDFTNQKRREGLSVRQALLHACPVRLRPILMTSIATVAAAIPPALNIGPGAESRVPMALSVIGGVFVSTLLTLLVVPCVYELMPASSSAENSEEFDHLDQAVREGYQIAK